MVILALLIDMPLKISLYVFTSFLWERF